MTEREGQRKWVECGQIGRAIGLKGDVAVAWASGRSPVAEGGELFISTKANPEEYRGVFVAALRKQGRSCVVRFEGTSDRSAAESLRGARIYLPEERLPALADGEYYTYQIVGLDVFTEEGELLGQVKSIFTAGETDVYEVCGERAPKGKELLIPAIADIVRSIDLSAGRIVVRLLDGMLDESRGS